MRSDTINTWLKYIIYTGIFLLPFLPLYVATGMFFPFIAGKGFAFRIIVEIIFAAWVILALLGKEYRPRWSWILGALTLYLVVLGVANLFGENPVRSFWSNFERMMGYVTQLHLFALFIVSVSVLKTKELWWKLANTSLAANAIIAGYSMFQLIGALVVHQGGDRIDATFGNATYLAVYTLFHVFIAAYLFAQKPQFPYARWIYGGFAVLNTFLLINTATRGAVLGLVGAALLTAALIAVQRWRMPAVRKWALGIILVVVVLSAGAYALRNTPVIQDTPAERLTNISLEQKTIQARFLVWNMAWQGVEERPLLGWGQGNFMLVFSKYYNPEMYNQEPWFDRAHSILFDTLVSSGFLGLLAYLSVIGSVLYYIWSPTSNPFSDIEKSILTGMGAAYVFQNLFVFDNIMSFILFFSSLAFIHVLVSEKRMTRILGERIRMRSDTALRYAAPVVVMAFALVFYFGTARGIIANTTLLEAINPTSISRAAPDARDDAIRGKLGLFQKAISYGPLGRIEAREQLAQFANRVYSAPVSEEIKQESFDFANEEVQQQIAEVPANTRYHMFHASLLSRYGYLEGAVDRIEKAIATSPKRQDVRGMLVQVLIAQGNIERAFNEANAAYEFEENNPEIRKMYAIAALEAGRGSIARELLSGGRIAVDGNLINAVVENLGDYAIAAELWKKQVERQPNNGQYRVSYAAALTRIGEREKAVEQIEKAIELESQFKEQGERLIEQIRAGRVPGL